MHTNESLMQLMKQFLQILFDEFAFRKFKMEPIQKMREGVSYFMAYNPRYETNVERIKVILMQEKEMSVHIILDSKNEARRHRQQNKILMEYSQFFDLDDEGLNVKLRIGPNSDLDRISNVVTRAYDIAVRIPT